MSKYQERVGEDELIIGSAEVKPVQRIIKNRRGRDIKMQVFADDDDERANSGGRKGKAELFDPFAAFEKPKVQQRPADNDDPYKPIERDRRVEKMRKQLNDTMEQDKKRQYASAAAFEEQAELRAK